MGCVESIEKRILVVEERIKQVMDADEYFVANMQVVAMTHVHTQQHILGDFEYMIADDDTRIKLRKFLQQLRDIDFNLTNRLFTELVRKQEYNFVADTRSSVANQIRQNMVELYKLEKEDVNNKNSIVPVKNRPLQLQVAEPENIPSFVRRLNYDADQYVNYSVELTKRVQELQEKWKQLYATYKSEEKKTREYLRNERKQKYKDLAGERDAYEKDLKKLNELIERKKKIKEELKKKKKAEELKNQKNTQELTPEEKQKKLDEENKLKIELEKQKQKEKEEQDAFNLLTPEQKEAKLLKQQQDAQRAKDLHEEFTRLNFELLAPDIKDEQKKEKNTRIDAIKDEYKKLKNGSELKFNKDDNLTKQISDQRQYIKTKYPFGEPLGPPSLYQRVSEDLDDFMYWIKPDQRPPRLDELENWDSLEENAKYFRSGLKQISKGRVAVVFLGGGMDTLSDQPNVPKGFADVGLNQDKCLYQIFADRIKAVQRLSYLYRPDKAIFRETDSVHVYVMTAPHNDEETRRRFRENLNFGLWKKNIHFFSQGSLPATDLQGKVLMKERLNILMTPDGNGGVYEAIERAGLIQEWKNKGIEYVHFLGIDNLLARPAEPILVGMAKGVKGEQQGLDLVSQFVKADEKLKVKLAQETDNRLKQKLLKADEKYKQQLAKETNEELKQQLTKDFGELKLQLEQEAAQNKTRLDNFGRIAFRNNLPTVVDHRTEKDKLKNFQEIFTCNFVARVDLIQTFIDYKEKWMRYHEINDRFTSYSPPDNKEEAEKLISPDQDVRLAQMNLKVNKDAEGYKYEKYIFDSWSLVHPKRFGLFEVPYDEQFAPIKKQQDVEQAVLQMSTLHYNWLTKESNYQFESLPSFEYHYKNAEQQKKREQYIEDKKKKIKAQEESVKKQKEQEEARKKQKEESRAQKSQLLSQQVEQLQVKTPVAQSNEVKQPVEKPVTTESTTTEQQQIVERQSEQVEEQSVSKSVEAEKSKSVEAEKSTEKVSEQVQNQKVVEPTQVAVQQTTGQQQVSNAQQGQKQATEQQQQAPVASQVKSDEKEPPKNDEQIAEEEEDDFEERWPRNLIEVDTKWSYNGEGLPRTTKTYTDPKDKEKLSFILFKREDIKPALPWGLDIVYRYV